MKEQFATYEIALKLKELGFDEPCFGWYSYEEFNPLRIQKCETYLGIESCTKAPLWQQVVDWFREAWNIQIEILWRGNMNMFCYKIGNFRYGSHKFSEKDYRQFEEAREQAILKALELIK